MDDVIVEQMDLFQVRFGDIVQNISACATAADDGYLSPEDPDHHTFLVVIAVAPEHAERAARATITAIQPLCEKERLDLDLTSFDPAAGFPDYLRNPGVERFYGPPLA